MAYMEEKRVQGVGMKTCMKEAFGRHRHRWKDNIKTDLKETGWDGDDWIYLAQDNLISKSINKTKATWNIVKTIMNKRNSQNKIASMNINNHLIHDPDIIANSFNSFFSSVAQNFTQEPSGNNFTQDLI